MSFDPIVQVSVSEQVAQRLLTMIRTGLLKPGQQLPPERELASMLGVGRPAVREAIRGLALLGLLRIRQGEGTFVGSLQTRELLEPLEMVIELNAGTLEALFDARLVIEPGVAAQAATHMSEADLARLHALVDDEQALLGNPERFSALDMAFHETIIDACGNPFLQSIANSLYLLGKKSRGVTSRIDGVLRRSLEDHRGIVAALEARDPARAAQAMRQHLSRVRDAYAASQAAGAEVEADGNAVA
ncbi:FadR family transcriptional regulator [Pandoraea nosoerga]|uniref:Transcriptional regulator n=1 Tax=Pandoraea nosoerga TaxID=2508296 RepID=A0A5E4VIF5_9BURK|nr:FadR/GntR family transcriptional regulator [Pandoraea nosoerga]MBN4665156.1 FadR family transcriptional regulator [Pandoraea nosoerga]MBN4677965.1 FadR family transcriptional regulator [Pandoraea nosoerga]MBN4683168.1 FadR family transcriptional regulator [Pandoraea nosoerga]MBN4747114.1 FadR family transcriptional regulator [Pandoraea nosoerga]VVE11786.1 transcriptional regulator [Pandoraea nosoerga]